MDTQAALHIFTSLPIDWLVVVIAALISLVDSMWAGTTKSVALAFAFPLAIYLYDELFHTAFLVNLLKQIPSSFGHAAIFAVLLVICWVLLHRALSTFDAPASFLLAALAAAATAICVIVYLLASPAISPIWHFSVSITNIFGTAYRLYWLLLAYLALAYVRS